MNVETWKRIMMGGLVAAALALALANTSGARGPATAGVAPAEIVAAAGRPFDLAIDLVHPDGMGALRAVELRIRDEDGDALHAEFDLDGGTVRLVDPLTETFMDPARPDEGGVIETNRAALYLGATRLPFDQAATTGAVTTVIAIKPDAANRDSLIELRTVNRDGIATAFAPAGTLTITGIRE